MDEVDQANDIIEKQSSIIINHARLAALEMPEGMKANVIYAENLH